MENKYTMRLTKNQIERCIASISEKKNKLNNSQFFEKQHTHKLLQRFRARLAEININAKRG